MNQFARQTVFVIFIALDKSAERRAGDDALIAVEGVFVFLVRDERMNLAAADQRDVAGLGAAKIFLQKNALGIIHIAAATRACRRPSRTKSCGSDSSASRADF